MKMEKIHVTNARNSFQIDSQFSIGSYISSRNLARLSHWLPLKKFEYKILGNFKTIDCLPPQVTYYNAAGDHGPFGGILVALRWSKELTVTKKTTGKTVDEDPAGCQRWISIKEIKSAKILRTKTEKSKDYWKADNNVYWFFVKQYFGWPYSLLQIYRCH